MDTTGKGGDIQTTVLAVRCLAVYNNTRNSSRSSNSRSNANKYGTMIKN